MKSEKPMIRRFVPLLIALAVLAVVVAVVAPTIAYYIINANDVGEDGGDYTPAKPVDPSFSLSFDNKEMRNVSIGVEDKGYPVYVRVSILITWQKVTEDGDTEVYFGQPDEGTDYTIEFNQIGWEKLDDYYYCTSPVASGKTTGVLINSCVLEDDADAPEGYVLNVEIIVQTIQAIGATDSGDVPAWKDAWTKGPSTWN